MSEKKSRPIWKWLFVFSMAANLLLIGLIAGALWNRGSYGALQKAQTEFLAALPEEKRPAMQKIFEDYDKRSRPHRWQMFWRYRKAIKAMEVKEPDYAKLQELVGSLSRTNQVLVKLRYQQLLDIVKELDYEERQKFIRIFRKRLRQIRKLEVKSR